MRIRVTAVLIGLVLVASACSSSSDSESATADADTPTTTVSATQETTAPEAATTTAAAEAGESGDSGGGSGTATVTLDNGESFTFSILCGLDPQESAGQEILFTAVSYDEPYNFDVTQFGKSTAGFDDHGSISIYDAATYDTVWGADSTTAQLSATDFTLDLAGDTIIGSATFFTGEQVDNLDLTEGVPGELVANCG